VLLAKRGFSIWCHSVSASQNLSVNVLRKQNANGVCKQIGRNDYTYLFIQLEIQNDKELKLSNFKSSVVILHGHLTLCH
jgi:hypothetical protein